MIYLFGDSWGFSYKQFEPQVEWKDSQIFNGADLASCIMEKIDNEVVNLCKRGSSLETIIERIYQSSKLFNAGDTLIVLQTDPLRSYFVKWYSRDINSIDIDIHYDFSFNDIVDYLIKRFYKKLKLIEKSFKVKILLIGGISKLNYTLAKEQKLYFIDKSASQIVLPYFKDNYYIESNYVLNNHLFFKENFNNYIATSICEIIDETDFKNNTWHNNEKYFTHNHMTVDANKIFAAEIVKHLKVLNENK